MRMKRLLVLLVTLGVSSTMVAVPAAAQSGTVGFQDVPPGAFYEIPVEWLVFAEITTGTTATTFSPNRPVTRGEVATFLWRMMGKPTAPSACGYDDSRDPNAFFARPVCWAKSAGLVDGAEARNFFPSRVLTRGEMAGFLWRIAGQNRASSPHLFSDVPSDDSGTGPAVRWLRQFGITNGVSDGRFGPAQAVNRGQMAAFIYRTLIRGDAWMASASKPSLLPTPPAPLNPLVVAGNQRASVSWSPGASARSRPQATGYEVSATEFGGTATFGCNAPQSATSCEIRGLTNGRRYDFKVRAANGAGSGVWSSVASATPAIDVSVSPPPAPGNIKVVTGAFEATVSWTGSQGSFAEFYKVEVTNLAGGVPGNSVDGPALRWTEGSNTFLRFTGLQANTDFRFKVTAFNDGGQSSPSVSGLTRVAASNSPNVPGPNVVVESATGPAEVLPQDPRGETLVRLPDKLGPVDVSVGKVIATSRVGGSVPFYGRVVALEADSYRTVPATLPEVLPRVQLTVAADASTGQLRAAGSEAPDSLEPQAPVKPSADESKTVTVKCDGGVTASFELSAEANFANFETTLDWEWTFFGPQFNSVELAYVPSLSAQLKAGVVANAGCKLANPLELFDVRLPDINFSIGPVPVNIQHAFKGSADANIDVRGEARVEAGASVEARLGLRVERCDSDPACTPVSPIVEVDADRKLEPSITATVRGEVRLNITYTAAMYGMLGFDATATPFVALQANATPIPNSPLKLGDTRAPFLALDAGLRGSFEVFFDPPFFERFGHELARGDLIEPRRLFEQRTPPYSPVDMGQQDLRSGRALWDVPQLLPGQDAVRRVELSANQELSVSLAGSDRFEWNQRDTGPGLCQYNTRHPDWNHFGIEVRRVGETAPLEKVTCNSPDTGTFGSEAFLRFTASRGAGLYEIRLVNDYPLTTPAGTYKVYASRDQAVGIGAAPAGDSIFPRQRFVWTGSRSPGPVTISLGLKGCWRSGDPRQATFRVAAIEALKPKSGGQAGFDVVRSYPFTGFIGGSNDSVETLCNASGYFLTVNLPAGTTAVRVLVDNASKQQIPAPTVTSSLMGVVSAGNLQTSTTTASRVPSVQPGQRAVWTTSATAGSQVEVVFNPGTGCTQTYEHDRTRLQLVDPTGKVVATSYCIRSTTVDPNNPTRSAKISYRATQTGTYRVEVINQDAKPLDQFGSLIRRAR
jgi:hypothetical protein